MKKVWCVSALLLVVVMATPAWSANEIPAGLMTPPQAMQLGLRPNAGASLAAAFTNVVYFPVRFAVTVVAAEVGGFVGWMTAGDAGAAHAVWQSTEGQAYITPAVIEGRERLRFGPWQ